MRYGKNSVMRNVNCTLLLLTVGLASSPTLAQVFDDIRVSRIGNVATIEVEFTCGMQYLHHQKNAGGAELTIELAPQQDCRLAFRDIASDLRRPMSGHLAHLTQMELQKDSDNTATLIVQFDQSLDAEIKQTSNQHMLTIEVDRDTGSNVLDVPAAIETPVATAPPAQVAPSREPTRQTSRAPASRNQYSIRLMRLYDPADINFDLLDNLAPAQLYTNQITVGDRLWSELKLGFYESEAEAEDVLADLLADFSLAWITVATPDEQVMAMQTRVEPQTEEVREDVVAVAAAPAAPISSIVSGSSEQVLEKMDTAKSALVRRDYAKSIALYEELLLSSESDHRREAREFLGVARQKNGELDRARAEFGAYLEEFPDGDESERVQQRLAALSAVDSNMRQQTTTQASAEARPAPATGGILSGWEVYGSASQYYLRGVNLAEGNNNEDLVAQSAMLSQARVVAHRRGKRFDVAAEANLGYLYDFEDSDTEQQALISSAYVDITDTKHDASIRVGRQRQLQSGVLSRFDGIHASYQYRPDIRINVTAGLPVDSRRYAATSDHYSYGASVDFDNLFRNWDFSVFANQQKIEGILDREAVGAEALFHGEDITVAGLIDFDMSYNIINTALINAVWRAHDRITVHGRIRSGVAPFLTTRNAIIGQQVNTVGELFDTYSEGQIRRLARQRTADERFASGGVSAAITERLQLRLDATYLEYSATAGSGGVPALPETGPQYSYGGHLQGSGYFGQGQVMQLGYRHTETRQLDTDTIWFDLRYPISEQIRAQGRLSYSNRIANQNPAGDIDNSILNPLLRIVYSGERPFRVELELGGRLSNQEFPLLLAPPLTTDATLEQKDYYVQLGYILDF